MEQAEKLLLSAKSFSAQIFRKIGVQLKRTAMFYIKLGGAYRDRTDDPLLAKQVLSQLS